MTTTTMTTAANAARRDALVLSFGLTDGGDDTLRYAELRDAASHVRVTPPAGATLTDVLSEAGVAIVRAALSLARTVNGVLSAPDFAMRVGGVEVRGLRSMPAVDREAPTHLTLRLQNVVGSAYLMFKRWLLPKGDPRSSAAHPTRVLEDVLIPLFNLRRFVDDGNLDAAPEGGRRLADLLRTAAERISLIEDCFHAELDQARRGPDAFGQIDAAQAAGVEAVLSGFRGEDHLLARAAYAASPDRSPPALRNVG